MDEEPDLPPEVLATVICRKKNYFDVLRSMMLLISVLEEQDPQPNPVADQENVNAELPGDAEEEELLDEDEGQNYVPPGTYLYIDYIIYDMYF